MFNEDILSYAREGNRWLFGHCNAGASSANKKGCFGSIEFWLNKEGIDNIFIILKLE